jgi:hypothetical protein
MAHFGLLSLIGTVLRTPRGREFGEQSASFENGLKTRAAKWGMLIKKLGLRVE